jgi:hypothetical protein
MLALAGSAGLKVRADGGPYQHQRANPLHQSRILDAIFFIH